MLWVLAAIGLLLLALALPHGLRLFLAAKFRCKPSVYTPADEVPENLGEFRRYAERVLKDGGFTTLDYQIEDAMTSDFAVVGMSADGLLCASAKQAGGIKLQLSVAALLNDDSVIIAALPRFMPLFESKQVRHSVSTASEFNDMVYALRLDIQALQQRGISPVVSSSVSEFLDRASRVDHLSVEHALASGQLQADQDSYSIPRSQWRNIARAIRAHEATYRAAMGYPVLKNAPKSPRELATVEIVGRAFAIVMFGLLATAVLLVAVALIKHF